jgi:hypothetical protein
MDTESNIYELLERGRLASALELAVQRETRALGGAETSPASAQTIPAHDGPVYTGPRELIA